jgi:A/G-specific adenine glycosylase
LRIETHINAPAFRHALLAWYGRHQRQLPWRGERDPYKIWISEIMLQQTRVAVVRDRYPDFLKRFPNVHGLARAPLSRVLAAWSGLGYYRRARNLHAAAKLVARSGDFPRTAGELRALPGIGRYTAAAIASIAFSEPVAVVDGNVERVLGRMLAVRGAQCWRAAETLLDPENPGTFNQAMMELGATVCSPRTPVCDQCPVRKFCNYEKLKTKSKKLEKRETRNEKRFLTRQHFLIARRGNCILLVQRNARASLMPSMWELPLAARPRRNAHIRVRHSITNTDFDVSASLASHVPRPQKGKWIPISRLSGLALTGLTRKLLGRALPEIAHQLE